MRIFLLPKGFRLIPETVAEVAWLEHGLGLRDDVRANLPRMTRVGNAFICGDVDDARLKSWGNASLPTETELGEARLA